MRPHLLCSASITTVLSAPIAPRHEATRSYSKLLVTVSVLAYLAHAYGHSIVAEDSLAHEKRTMAELGKARKIKQCILKHKGATDCEWQVASCSLQVLGIDMNTAK